MIHSRTGKSTGKHNNCFNIRSNKGTVKCIGLGRDVDTWRTIEEDEEETLITATTNSTKILNAKKLEVNRWKDNEVFVEVDDQGQPALSVRWVVTEKIKNNRRIVKARLVARGFEEENKDFRTDSPTCAKETLRIMLMLIGSYSWQCNSLDIKSAFLQGNAIEREVFVKPPKQFEDGKLWKLCKTVYGLCDAPRAWYMSVKGALTKLGMVTCKLDQALFFHYGVNNDLDGIICFHVDDFLWAGSRAFESKVIQSISAQFKVGLTASCAFKYIGINIEKNLHGDLTMDQVDYTNSLSVVPVSNNRSQSGMLTVEETRKYCGLVSQLNWISTQTRPDIQFDVYELSSVVDKAKVDD